MAVQAIRGSLDNKSLNLSAGALPPAGISPEHSRLVVNLKFRPLVVLARKACFSPRRCATVRCVAELLGGAKQTLENKQSNKNVRNN